MLYIIRHGRTDWNDDHRIQGHTDTELNEVGRKMAAEAAALYRNIHFDICYCSPLKRAKETAEILLKGRNVPIITDDRLKEMGFGKYEGMKEIFSMPECPLNVFFNNPEKYVPEEGGGESLDELFLRSGSFLKEVVEPGLKEGKDILIVGHGALNSGIICRIKYGCDKSRFWEDGIPNCKLMRLK